MVVTSRVTAQLEAARVFACANGLLDDLEANLERLANIGLEGRTRVTLHHDSAPYSFGFVIEVKDRLGRWQHWVTGGLLFHGPHDGHGSGAAPVFATTLVPTTGWSIHT